jgi:hypothetical protein
MLNNNGVVERRPQQLTLPATASNDGKVVKGSGLAPV